MCLRHPAMQRNNPRQQTKTDHAEHPDIRAKWHQLRTGAQEIQFQRAVALPHQPAGQCQQESAEAPKRKPQFAGLAAAGQEHAAQSHDFRHHHQRGQVAGDDRTDGGGEQEIDQQTVRFGLRVAVPVDIKQADKQAAQAKGDEPDSVQRRELNGVANQRHSAFCMDTLRQHHKPGQRRYRTTYCPADPGGPSAEGFVEREHQRQHGGGHKPGHGAVNQSHSIHFAPSFCA
ncbi:hypothetical protein D3C76_1150370 [compost metagenome]